MNDFVEQRAVHFGQYIIENKATVRQTAKVFGISKSTVHKDVSQRLKYINKKLYAEVKDVLEENKSQRHIRGGIATRQKYLELKENKGL
ncbi:MAG: sporulation transcriptional regulator SpoIIID [Clostridia bacterium]